MINIRYIGGNCPVQAEGTIGGKEFYFRARWDSWAIGIGGDQILDPDWGHEETYYNAGWMNIEDAIKLICKAEVLYRLHRKRGARKHI